MELIAHNNPAAKGPIQARPVLLLPGAERATDPENDIFLCVVHGGGSNTVRVQAFQSRTAIERVFQSQKTGEIHGTPGAALVRSNMIITAAHGVNSNRLRLISWKIQPGNTDMVRRLHDSGNQIGEPGGTADLVYIGGTKLVVLVKTRGGNLKVILFNVSSSGKFERLDGDEAGGIHDNASIAFATHLDTTDGLPTPFSPGPIIVTTAVHSSQHKLKLINWEISGEKVERKGDSGNDGPRMDGRPALAGAPMSQQVVAAFRDGPILILRSYGVKTDGSIRPIQGTILPNEDVKNSPSITFSRGLAGGGEFATAVTHLDNSLRVDRWSLSATGGIGHISGTTSSNVSTLSSVRGSGSPWIISTVVGTRTDPDRNMGYYTAVRELGTNNLFLAKWR